MELNKGSLLEIITNDIFEYQDKFVEHYNNSENKITATSELNSIREGLNILSFDEDDFSKKLKGLEELLDYEIRGISEFEIIKADQKKENSIQTEYKRLTELKFELIDRISMDLEEGNLTENPKSAHKKWRDTLTRFYQISEQKQHKEKVLFFVDSIYDDAIKRNKKIVMEAVLILLLENIYIEEFPQEIQIYKDQQADKILGMTTAMGNPIFKKNQWHAPDGFYKRATEVVRKNPNYGQEGIYDQLMDEFYGGTSKENEKPSYSTVRRRLKERHIF